jgi:hypothetical protein
VEIGVWRLSYKTIEKTSNSPKLTNAKLAQISGVLTMITNLLKKHFEKECWMKTIS